LREDKVGRALKAIRLPQLQRRGTPVARPCAGKKNPNSVLIPSRKERLREGRRNSYSVIIVSYNFIGLNRRNL